MATETMEERLSALEAEVAQLKTQLQQKNNNDTVPWWQQISGVFKDDPMFDEAMRLGREWRESQREEDEEDLNDNEKPDAPA